MHSSLARLSFWNAVPALLLAAVCGSYFAATGVLARTADDPSPPRYVRVLRDAKDRASAMETATVRYSNGKSGAESLIVDLVSVVHVGDKSYYEAFNKTFKEYDAVLYELVAPRGTRVTPDRGRSNGSPVSAIQLFMKDKLQLTFQLEEVDYSPANFVHADMSPEQLFKSMEDRNETPLAIIRKLMQASLQAQATRKRPPPNEMVMLGALFDKKNGPFVLKQMFADELGESDTMLQAFNGSEGSTLVSERNKVCLEVLGEEIARGKKKIAVFYGAGHMPDFHERLLNDFHLKLGETTWQRAWTITPPAKKAKKKSPAAESVKVAEPAADKAN